MGSFKLKTVLAGLMTFAAISWLYANAVVDASFDDNQNDFEYYWYYYDDNNGVAANDRPQKAPTLKPSVIDVKYTEKERHAFDRAADKWKIKEYTFTTDNSFSKKCATMPFTFGEPWEASYCAKGKACALPFVGIGTMLCAEKKAIDLTGVDTISFFIKARKNALSGRVKLQTLQIDAISNVDSALLSGDEFGYYGAAISIPQGDWAQIKVAVKSLALPGIWAYDTAFDITKCTKLSWEVLYDKNVTSDTLDIADVSFIGSYKFNSPSYWMKVETSLPTDPKMGAFATFDTPIPNQAPAPILTYWYAYNDASITGASTVDPTFATQDPDTKLLDLNFVPATGSGGVGKGAALSFVLGPPIQRDTIQILGFVGIGVNLYDSVKTKYFNADSAGIKSVYFEYMTDGPAKCLTLELSDFSDVGDATTPARKDLRGSGIVYYRNFPATAGAWCKVLIPIDSLVIHDTWEGYHAIPLDKKKLAKIQWKVQGAKGLDGAYAIDNICFPGADFGQTIGVKTMQKSSAHPSFSAKCINGAIRVNWTGTTKLARGTVSLITARGSVVASVKAVNESSFSTGFSSAMLSAGKYFVCLNGVNADGKAIVMQAPITIIK